MAIDWNYPRPGPGLKGHLERFLGPGMTCEELFLNGAGLGILTILILLPLYFSGISWSVLQWILAILITLDICGGALTLAMAPAKRWVHREEKTFSERLGFVAVHVHPFIIAFFFAASFLWAGIMYLLVLVGGAIVLKTPLYLKRPVSVFFIALSIVLGGLVPSPEGFFWFAPLFAIKLIGGHCTYEEPYRP